MLLLAVVDMLAPFAPQHMVDGGSPLNLSAQIILVVEVLVPSHPKLTAAAVASACVEAT
jgi:hypothetical protein